MNIEWSIYVEADSSKRPNEVIRRADGPTEDAAGECYRAHGIGRWWDLNNDGKWIHQDIWAGDSGIVVV